MVYYAIITRRGDTREGGRWTLGNSLGGHCYESKAEAIGAARAEWAGTGIEWRLVTIPGAED